MRPQIPSEPGFETVAARPPQPTARALCSSLATAEPGTTVTLEGWVHRRRELARVTFLVLRDRSGLAQVVLPAGTVVPPEETVVRVTGTATANAQAPGGVEVTEAVVEPLTEPAATPPVELWRPALDASLPTLLDHAPVLWRHPAQRSRWELAAASLKGFRATLDGLGFTEIATPKFVESATESGANVFAVDYFGRPAYLAQSPQFYKQQLVGVFERVYEVGPVFRAEPHDTVRHLAEYRSLDVELGFIRDHRDVLAVLREVLAGMVASVAACEDAVVRTGARLPVVPEEIPVIHFADALELVGAPADEPDLAPEHERVLGAWALAEHGSDFLAVEGYPMAKRPFYTHPQPEDPRYSRAFDLLFRGLELVTGGQRLHRASAYDEAIRARGEDPADYAAYLQAFRHGMPPHGGFAIGLERWVGRLVEAANVREVTLFPRDLHRLSP
ncbi:nondiscriminating aspartyl-tRNA synthetase [Nocardioides sp. BE266]|uniref:aspartate--tRNA(Asn) ligase n=1 Tax=Nocardioides sp. BE266 TaxID=2817725 RepID=UPI002859E277|nr:aspartate--tRNA(Asn) ligase [Nocardioides sp. BE266]MDR7252630.1 nondiscriminating aspartyl-tRNA synthetase [Nocardioides sp. BE266]